MAEHEQQGEKGADTATGEAEQRAEKIAAEGENLEERIRLLVQELFRERKLEFSQLNDLVREVLEGASAGIERTLDEKGEKAEALRKVYAGLSDAVAAVVKAFGTAVEQGRERGQKFAQEDVKEAFEELSSLEKKFLDTLWQTAGSFNAFLREELQEIVEEARKAGTKIGPAVKEAGQAAAKEPFGVASQAAEAGLRAAAQSAGLLMQAVGSFLEATGEMISDRASASDASKDAEGESKSA